jgi:glycosyltransferase involved in cell wall biosynthesis
VILDEQTGLLVPPDDVPALTSALARLIANPDEQRVLGEAGRARADSLFTVERMVSEFHACYAELAARPRLRMPVATPYKRLLGLRATAREVGAPPH